jgi:hypothetical protein
MIKIFPNDVEPAIMTSVFFGVLDEVGDFDVFLGL